MLNAARFTAHVSAVWAAKRTNARTSTRIPPHFPLLLLHLARIAVGSVGRRIYSYLRCRRPRSSSPRTHARIYMLPFFLPLPPQRQQSSLLRKPRSSQNMFLFLLLLLLLSLLSLVKPERTNQKFCRLRYNSA
jgi:hypothetical protein